MEKSINQFVLLSFYYVCFILPSGRDVCFFSFRLFAAVNASISMYCVFLGGY